MISVVVPARNEAGNIRRLVERIGRSLPRNRFIYEIIFIDDRSTDNTAEIIRSLSLKYPVSLYRKKGKTGKAQSLLEGFSHASYPLLAMIDADLQYPPEALPDLIYSLGNRYGVAVGNRKENGSGLKRRIFSRVFSLFFGKFLHGFDCDVQSGIKVFRKEIIERIKLSPSPWTFDLEFLIKARDAGYKITGVNIRFDRRFSGKPKIRLLSGSLEIGLSALRLKLKSTEVIPFHRNSPARGEGFHFKGLSFIPHTKLNLTKSAFYRLNDQEFIFISGILLIFMTGLIINWHFTLTALVAILTLIYFSDILFNLILIYRGFAKPPEIQTGRKLLAAESKKDWPLYTILCPLYHEWKVLPQFVSAVSKLDYPEEKLQVLLLLEEDDEETVREVKKISLPPYFDVITVPQTLPKTKPKALNYGLKLAKGEFITVYDAEDIPDPYQLKKAALALLNGDKKLVCVQAKLDFYNPHQNILTRIFSAEYALWFDLVLTGLQSVNAPIPLGGTSNHFRTKDLRKFEGWDSFNVTEDCDLGIRLAKLGYRTAIIDSVTREEANSSLLNWIRQRSRWIKGYIQTYLVHIRDMGSFRSSGSRLNMPAFQLIVGGKVLSAFINPFMWLLTFSYFAFRLKIGTFIESFFPAPVLYMGVFSLIFGNFLYMYYYMIGCAKRGYEEIIKYVFLVPLYWLTISISSWLALYEVIVDPFHWSKTHHGLHLPKTKAVPVPVIPAVRPAFAGVYFSRINGFRLTLTDRLKTFSLSEAGFLVGAIMFGNIMNFSFNAYLGRVLPFEEFGLVTLFSTLLFFLSIVINALIATVNHRVGYLSAKIGAEAGDAFFRYVTVRFLNLSLIFTLIWMLVLPLTASFFNISGSLPLFLFTPVFTFGIIYAIMKGLFQAKFHFRDVGILLMVESGSKLLTAFLFARSGNADLAYLSIPASIVCAFFVSLILFRTKSIRSTVSKNYSFPKKFFTAAILSGLSANAFLTFDVILVKHFFTPELAGEYSLLSLVGKMVFFLGSLPNIFIIPYIAKEEGMGKNSLPTFYKLFSLTSILVLFSFMILGPLGKNIVPVLFGAKSLVIISYLTPYVMTIALVTLTNTFITYHLARQQFVFSFISILMAVVMSAGITLYHQDVASVVAVMFYISLVYFTVVVVFHFIQRGGKFVLRSITDLLDAFFPLPPLKAKEGVMRILIFNWRDIRHVYAGGAEAYIHELAKRWASDGHLVTVFCGNDGISPKNETVDGVRIYRRGGFYLVYLWAFLYYFLQFRGRYDVIIDSQNGIPFFTPLYAREPVYSLMHHVHQEVFRKSLIWPVSAVAAVIENSLMPWIYRNTQFITVSNSTRDEMEKLGIRGSGIHVVNPGVDLARFKPGKISPNPLVLYIGRLKYYKRIDVLIHAAVNICAKIPDALFVIAGDGEEKQKLVNLVKQLKLTEKIRFLGKISEEKKIQLYKNAWVFVNPSMMEGWGMTTVEAHACGVPVVASDVPGLRDSVNNPHDGILVPLGDVGRLEEAVSLLLTDPNTRINMSLEARSSAKKYHWKKSADKCLKILSDRNISKYPAINLPVGNGFFPEWKLMVESTKILHLSDREEDKPKRQNKISDKV